MLQVVRDMAHAARSLAKTRSFTIVVVASLGIGMGTFVGLVTFIRSMTAPVRGVNPEGLVELLVTPTGPLKARTGDWAIEQWSYPDFIELREADTGMDLTGWAIGESHHQRVEGTAPVAVPTMFVSANYFSTIGLSLMRGPGFDPTGIDALSDATSAPTRVVVGYDFWRNVLSSDPDIIGKTITLDRVPHIVAGIAPVEYRGHLDADASPSVQLFALLGRHPRLRTDNSVALNREIDWVHIYGRLSPGIRIAQANSTVSAIVAGLAERFPATNEFKASTVEPYYVRGARIRPSNVRARFWLLSLSGMVLLIVCLNICGMMLVRGASRERELSIREALGAGRRCLIQYLLSEAILLAFMGGALSAFVLFGIPALVPINFVRRAARVASPNSSEFVNAHYTRVAEGYLDTIGVSMLRGRSITAEDRAANARVAVISEPLALQLFPDGNAIGERLRFALDGNREQEFTIVGVSADFATSQLTTTRPQFLLPLPEEPTSKVFLIARGAAGDEEKLTSAFLNAVREFDPDFTPEGFIMGGFITGPRIVEKSIGDLIAESAVVAITGAVVLVLAALGISGVIGFMVATRTREIAVRMALGASRLRVVGLMLSDVVKLVLPGLAGGLLIAAVLVRGFLPVPAGGLEPVAYMVAAAIAVGVALVAGLPSARRAASVHPMVAMRSE